MTRIRPRVRPLVAERFRALEAITNHTHAKLFRLVLLGGPVLAASHLRLWRDLARTAANCTQLDGLISDLPDTPVREDIIERIRQCEDELRVVRKRLLGLEVR